MFLRLPSQNVPVLTPSVTYNDVRIKSFRAQSLFHVPMVIKKWKSIVKKIWSKKFVFETTISTYWSFHSLWWHHQPKNRSERSKLVFHVPMLIERCKANFKIFWGELVVYETVLSKFWSFDSMRWRHQLKVWLKIGPKLVYHVVMMIERWKSKVKVTLRSGTLLWNYFIDFNYFINVII